MEQKPTTLLHSSCLNNTVDTVDLVGESISRENRWCMNGYIWDILNLLYFSTQSSCQSSPPAPPPSSGCQDSLASHPHFHCFPEPASGLFTGWYRRYFYSEGGIFWRSGSDHTMRVWTEAMSSCRCGDYKEAALLPEIRARGNILSRWETNQRTGLWGGLSIVGVPGTREEIAAASCSRSRRNLTF